MTLVNRLNKLRNESILGVVLGITGYFLTFIIFGWELALILFLFDMSSYINYRVYKDRKYLIEKQNI